MSEDYIEKMTERINGLINNQEIMRQKMDVLSKLFLPLIEKQLSEDDESTKQLTRIADALEKIAEPILTAEHRSK